MTGKGAQDDSFAPVMLRSAATKHLFLQTARHLNDSGPLPHPKGAGRSRLKGSFADAQDDSFAPVMLRSVATKNLFLQAARRLNDSGPLPHRKGAGRSRLKKGWGTFWRPKGFGFLAAQQGSRAEPFKKARPTDVGRAGSILWENPDVSTAWRRRGWRRPP